MTIEQRHEDFYHNLRGRIVGWLNERGQNHKYAHILLLAPDLFHLLGRLVLDPRVPGAEKAKLGIALAYFMSPFDLLPEFLLGPIGLLDDVAIAAFALNSVINHGQGEIAREHWAGDGDVLNVIQNIIGIADNMLGSGLPKRLRGLLDGTP